MNICPHPSPCSPKKAAPWARVCRARLPVPWALGSCGLSQPFAFLDSHCSKRAGRRWSARWPSTSRTGTSWFCVTPTSRVYKSDRSRNTPTFPSRQVPRLGRPWGLLGRLHRRGPGRHPRSRLCHPAPVGPGQLSFPIGSVERWRARAMCSAGPWHRVEDERMLFLFTSFLSEIHFLV